MRTPATPRNQLAIQRRASSRSRKSSPRNPDSRTKFTTLSIRGLSVGGRIRAGSISKRQAWAYSRKAWLKRGAMGSASITIAFSESGDDHPEHASEEAPGLVAALDNLRQCLPEAEPAEQVPAVAGGEDQRPAQPPPALRSVFEQAHPAEVELQLLARLAVGHRDRLPQLPCELQLGHAEGVQRLVGHKYPPASQQAVQLGQPQARLQPLLQELPLPVQLLPGPPYRWRAS